MIDIVERLRAYTLGDQLYHPLVCSEAADEIERLRAEVFEWKSRCIQSDDILREMRADLDPPQCSTGSQPDIVDAP